jgi:branched-subunit amino acid aminotransferase/4-amino-4-deoxychorismate lyase
MLAGLKHSSRLDQVLAAREYSALALDEAVMLDQRGGPVAVVGGNLLLVLDGELRTAPMYDCGVAGTRRQLVLESWAPALGLAVREEPYTCAQVEEADEVFYSNSLLGLRPVAQFGQRRWTSHPVCAALFTAYQSDLA